MFNYLKDNLLLPQEILNLGDAKAKEMLFSKTERENFINKELEKLKKQSGELQDKLWYPVKLEKVTL